MQHQIFARRKRSSCAVVIKRDALYARLGLLRSTIEQHNLPHTSADLARELETNALLQSDKQLRMFCLIVKGDIDEEIDVRTGRRDWEQVEALFRSLAISVGRTEHWLRLESPLSMIAISRLREKTLERPLR